MNSNADAVVEQEDGSMIFVEPHETVEPFERFLHDLQESSKTAGLDGRNVKYAQTRT